jgi:hypothetical protein
MQLDIGFGDVVVPAAIPTTYPTILDLPAPNLLGYSRETAVAEKFEAMVKVGAMNCPPATAREITNDEQRIAGRLSGVKGEVDRHDRGWLR